PGLSLRTTVHLQGGMRKMSKSRRVARLLAAAVLSTAVVGVVKATPGHAAAPACPTLNGVALTQTQDFTPSDGTHEIVVCNAWVANQGFVTMTYTPRGWYDSCGQDPNTNPPYSFQNDSACTGHTYTDSKCTTPTQSQQSWVHLYDRRYEIRDAQFLAGQVYA